MSERIADNLSWSAILQLSKLELIGTSLIILSFALLPIGRVVEISTALMALSGLLLICKNQSRLALLNSQSAKFFSVLFALIWLPMLLSVIGTETLKNSALFSFKYLRFFFAGLFILNLLKSSKLRNLVLVGISFTVALWLLDSLLQWIMGVDLLGRSYIGTRLAGPFSHLTLPVILSLFLTLVLIFTKRYLPNYLFYALFLLSVLILFLAGSRASWIALLLAGGLYSGYVFFRAPNKPILMFVLLIVGAITVGTTGYLIDSGFKDRIDSASKLFAGDYESVNQATSLRLPIWEVAAKMALDNPLNGVGVRGFRYQYKAYAGPNDPFKDTGAMHPHFFLLEVFVEAGVIGFLGLLAITVLLVRLAWKNRHQWTPLQAGSAITIAVTFFPFNTHVSLYGSFYSQIAWLATAIACAWLFERQSSERKKI
jgi:O-antigen ligase